MYSLYIRVEHLWVLVNTYGKLKSAVHFGKEEHDLGEVIRITDRSGNDYTELVYE